MKRYNFFPGRDNYDDTITSDEYRLLLLYRKDITSRFSFDRKQAKWVSELFRIDAIREDEHHNKFIHWLTHVMAFAIKYSRLLRTT